MVFFGGAGACVWHGRWAQGKGGCWCEQEMRQAEVVESTRFAVVLGSFEGQQGYLGTARSPPACLWGFPALSPVFWGEKLLSH